MNPYPRLRSSWQLMAARRSKFCFLQGCGPWEVDHAPTDRATPMHVWAVQIELSERFKS